MVVGQGRGQRYDLWPEVACARVPLAWPRSRQATARALLSGEAETRRRWAAGTERRRAAGFARRLVGLLQKTRDGVLWLAKRGFIGGIVLTGSKGGRKGLAMATYWFRLGSNEGGAVTRRCRADSVLCRQSRNGGVVDRGRWLDGGVHRAATALDLLLGSAASLVQAVVAFHGVLAALPGRRPLFSYLRFPSLARPSSPRLLCSSPPSPLPFRFVVAALGKRAPGL